MKKKRIISLLAILLIISGLIFPIKTTYKDGGSVQYKSLTYTVINYHILGDIESNDEIIEGTGVKFLGFVIKDIDNGYLK